VALLPEGVDPDEMALRSRNKLSEILSAPVNLFKFLELCAARYFGGMRSPEFLEALSQNLRGLTTSPLLEMALNELGEKMGLSFLSSRGAKLERSEEDIYNAVSNHKHPRAEHHSCRRRVFLPLYARTQRSSGCNKGLGS